MELRDTAKAADGFDLAVTRFPAEGIAWATLLLAGAMGVRQDFYEPLARFLAENGIHVLTFDYQGIGHFGYFLPESRDNAWRDTVSWLRERAAA